MSPHASSWLRRLIPRRLISGIRLLGVFQGQHGHTRTRAGLIVDGEGNVVPWLTYPAIEYLKGLDLSGRTVFEFGTGASTLFWASRAASVVGIENDEAWFARVKSLAPANVSLFWQPDGHLFADQILTDGRRFDLIVVDGAERHRCAINALERISPTGAIILDNSEWYPRTAAMLSNAGLIELRFSGFSPLNAFTSTTSIFLQRAFDIPTAPSGRRPPVGGKQLACEVLDDG